MSPEIEPPQDRSSVTLRDIIRAPLTNIYLLQELQLMLNNLCLTGEETVLDVGCGAGTSTLVLAKYARKVTAIDISDPIISYLNSNYHQPNIEFLCLDACDTSIGLTVGEFDKCVCIDTLGYVSFPHKLVRFVSHNLRSGGLLVLTTPARSPLGKNEFTKEDVFAIFQNTDFDMELEVLRTRRLARWLNGFSALCQKIGAKEPLREEKLQGMDNRRFEDIAYPCMVLLRQNLHKQLIPIKVITYLLFWLCKSAYEKAESGNRYLVLARKK